MKNINIHPIPNSLCDLCVLCGVKKITTELTEITEGIRNGSGANGLERESLLKDVIALLL